MKYRLNKLPVKTTNSFKINDLEVDIEIPKITDFNDYEILNSDKLIIEKNIKCEEITSRIGLTFSKYVDLHIIVPKNVMIKEPVLINYNFSNSDNLIDKINIEYQDNSYCDFIITFNSIDNGYHFHSLIENTISNINSSGSITYINSMNNNSYNFISIENDCMNNSSIIHNIFDISGNLRVYNIYSNVYDNSKNYVNNIYIGCDDSKIDMNYYLNNIGKRSVNKMIVEGALNDNSIKNFRGTIDFLEGSINAIGDECENCVLLSDNARSRSLPQMLCHEENVVGSHGVSSGKIDSLKLFYIMSRGYSKRDAEKLIIMANFIKIINEIPDKKTRDEIQNKIEKILS